MKKTNLKMSLDESASLYILLGNLRTLEKFAIASDNDLQYKIDFLIEMVYDLQEDDKPCRDFIYYISNKVDFITSQLIEQYK